MRQVNANKPRHGLGHLVGDYQESPRAQEKPQAREKAPGHLVGNFQESAQDQKPLQDRREANLGRPDPDEDKDMNKEQLKGRPKGREEAADAGVSVTSTGKRSAARLDPTGRKRAGEPE